MSTKNEPAYPHLHESCQRINDTEHWTGLTKLEAYAIAAMGLFSMGQRQVDQLAKGNIPDHGTVVKFCFDLAEAMIAEGEKRK